MKKAVLLTIVLFAICGNISAQHYFGYFSLDQVMKSMPEYSESQKSLSELKEKYDAEMQRVESDFNSKYEEFLEGQKDFPAIILQKRQTELQEMMEKNIAFKEEAKRLYKQAEDESINSMKSKIMAAIRAIGEQHKYAFIINTDNDACPWVDSSQGVNVDAEILKLVRQ